MRTLIDRPEGANLPGRLVEAYSHRWLHPTPLVHPADVLLVIPIRTHVLSPTSYKAMHNDKTFVLGDAVARLSGHQIYSNISTAYYRSRTALHERDREVCDCTYLQRLE